MRRKGRRKFLWRAKSRTPYAKRKQEKENLPPSRPEEALRNEVICAEAATTTTHDEEITQSSLPNLNEHSACFAQVESMGNGSHLPSAKTSPTTPAKANLFCGGTDSLISPSTGVLTSRKQTLVLGDAFEEETLFNFTPVTRNLGCADGSLLSGDALEEQKLELPTLVTIPTENYTNAVATVDEQNTDNKLFTVSSMCLIDAANSGIYQCQPEVEVSNAGTSISWEECPSQSVQDLLVSQLPQGWEVAAGTGSRTSFVLRMSASEDLWCLIQRTALISKDGTVQLAVHGHFISLDHPIWQELPCRVGLTNRESVDEFVHYVLEVVRVFRSHVVCVGIPESKYAALAEKHSGLVFDSNTHKESRYNVTYRSESCKMLLSAKIKTKKFCSPCSAIRHSLLRRYRTEDPMQSPHFLVNNEYLDSTHKSTKLSWSIKNSSSSHASG